MEAQELLEHEPNAPSDAEQLDDVNNIAAIDPVTIPEDPVVIPEAMNNEPMVQSNTAAWALTTLVQEQQLRAPEVVEISDEERADNGTTGVNTDIDDLGGGNGSGQLDDDDFHAPSTNADFAAFAIPAGSFKDMDSKPDQVSTQRPGDGEADVVTCPICMEAWTSIGSHRICSLACGHLFGKSCIKRWLRQAGKKQGKCPQCNCRARVEDLRTLYVPRIAVIDGEGQQIMQQEVGVLRAQNAQLKMQISELMEEIHRSQALLSVLCPEQHDALNAFQWTRCQQLQRTPESLRALHQPIHPRIIPVPSLHQVAQENDRQFPTNIGQADLKNCRKYQSHKLQTQFAQRSSCNYTGESGMRNQASPELRVLQERNIWGQSYALESSRISECAGIREPRQGKRDSTQARPLRTFSSLASIGSRGLKSTFVLQDEVPLQGAKVFDVNAHSQLLLVSHKPADSGASSGLMKMSLMALSEGECIDVPSGTSVIRDIRIAPSGTRAPGRLALVASLGKKLTVFSLESNNVVITYALQSPSWSCAWDPCDPNQVYSGLQNGSLLVFDMRQTGAPIATLKGPSCNPIHTLQHVPEHSRLAEQGESVKETSGLLSASCSSLCFWSDIGSSNLQTDAYRPMCLSQPAEASVCVSLAYNAVIDMAVASFRPKPTQFVDVEARSTSSPSPTLSSPAEVPSQPTDSLGLPEDMGLLPSHISYSRKPKSPFPGEDKDRSTVLDEPSFFWEQQGRMVGHKSQRVMSRSAIVCEWQPDQASGSRTNPETGSLYAFGDEGSNSVWLWDLVSRAKTQSLIPHHSPVLDIRSVHTAGADILGCISERTLQVYRRLPP
ncbi:hypothetical protein CY35_08G061300 [Sphagnum magellanicum]|nr:hypothetical protein CY35_08G061300 [Sphagnum magellanicum]KAH9554389.1 hypothetical protein CY35_08G061300 [Sphagnum magellanicum]